MSSPRLNATSTLLLAGLVLFGCREEGSQPSIPPPSSAPSSAASPPASASAPALASAPASAPPAPPKPPAAALELVGEPIADKPSARKVILRGPALPAPETLAEVKFPNSCSAFVTSDDQWRVSCTPNYRRALAVAHREGSELALTVLPYAPKERRLKIPLADGQPLGEPTLIEPRPAPCAGSQPQEPVEVSLHIQNFAPGFTPRSPLGIYVKGKPAMTLIETYNWWHGCANRLADGAVVIECKRDTHAAKIWAEGPSVHFKWRERGGEHQGSVLLPCERKPELKPAPCFSCNNAYF